jgi:hypothetical protein
MDPKKFWSQILNHNTKENNMIPLRDWNSYLKSLYEFPNSMDTIPIVPTEDAVFSLDDIEFGVKQLANGKAKDIEGYQAEIFKIKGPILIPHIHKIFNLAVKKGFPLTGIVINLLLYVDDIVLMARSPHDLENQLRILKDFCSNMGMTVNTDKTKVMIIKSNKITYDTFIYDNNNLEEVTSYKYLGIDIHHKLNWNYSIEKMIIGGWKAYYGLENNCN